jgi:hypothetical protein
VGRRNAAAATQDNPMEVTPEKLPLDALTLEQVRDRFHQLMEEGRAGQYEMGRIYNHMVREQLVRRTGFWNVKDYFRERIKVLSYSTVSTYGAVARTFSARACIRHGVHRLYALMRYMEAARTWDADAEDPGGFLVTVPEEDGTVAQRPFSDCETESLDAATEIHRYPGRRVPLADARRIQRLQVALRSCVSGSHRSPVRASARAESGRTFVTLKDVPLDQLEKLVEALRMELSEPPVTPRALVAV